MRFGTSSSFMILKLIDTTGQEVASMLDNDAQLGFYSPRDFYTIHIIDLDPSTVNFDNMEGVPKYEISEEAYDSLDVNFRKFKEVLVKTQPDLVKPNNQQVDDEFQAEEAREIQVGNRCRINPGDKRGVVRYVGKMSTFKPGWFVGVELDEPLGKNNGGHGGVRYFECQQNMGLFLRPSAVEVGNFRPYEEDDEV